MWTPSTEEISTLEERTIAENEARRASVDAERDRRIADGFEFNGAMYQARPIPDLQNISGAANAATIAVINGAQEGDFRWADPDDDFEWIASDNTLVKMDAPTTIAFGQAALRWVDVNFKAARELKDLEAVPIDYTDDGYWP